MLKFVSVYLALSYLAFAALVAAGVLQVLAAWRSLAGFALLDYRRRPAWRHALGPALIVVGYVWFFGTRREIITPGPAGAELTILFGGGVLLALGATLLGAAILSPYRRPSDPPGLAATVQRRSVRLAQGTAMLFQDPRQSEPGPAICLLPDPGAPGEGLAGLADRLAEQGWTALVLPWEEDLQQYPDALALVPGAMTFLSRQPLIDGRRLVVGGAGLGGDLALRAAAEDDDICAAVALAPLLEPANARPGLGLLDEMTCPQAVRWLLGGRRQRLLGELASAEAVARIAPRPVLVVYGDQDALVPMSRARTLIGVAQEGHPPAELRTVAGEGHRSLAGSAAAGELVAEWLESL